MEVTVRVERKICILKFNGQLNRQTLAESESTINKFIDDLEIKGFIFNLESITYMDSFGIGIIADTFKSLEQRKKPFYICKLPEKVKFLLEMMNLHNVVGITEEVEEAISKVESDYDAMPNNKFPHP